MIELEIEGEKVFLPYDVIAYFESIAEAKEYADKNSFAIEVIDD